MATGAKLTLETVWDIEMYLLVTDSRYFLNDRSCRDHIRQNDFDIRENWSQLVFVPVSGSIDISLLV